MTATATTDNKGAALPAGITWDISTNAYWIRADFMLCRAGSRYGTHWELTDTDTLETRRFKTEAAGIAALARLA